MYRIIALPLMEVLHYSTLNMEICNGIMFDFHPGLPHAVKDSCTWHTRVLDRPLADVNEFRCYEAKIEENRGK